MRDERWEEICEMIQDKLTLHSRTSEPDNDNNGFTETLLFEGPQGTMRLSRTVRGRFMGEKTFGSKRIGGDVQVERQYSDTETVDFMKLERKDPDSGEWLEIKLSDLGLGAS